MIVTKLNLLLNVPIEGYYCIRVVASVSTSLAPLPTRAAHTKQIVRHDETSKQHFYYFLIYFFYSHYSIYLIICICTRFLWYVFNQFNLLYHLVLLRRCCIYYVPRSYFASNFWPIQNFSTIQLFASSKTTQWGNQFYLYYKQKHPL